MLLPPNARLAGWSALVHALKVEAPVRSPSCISDQYVRGNRVQKDGWNVFDKRYWPGATVSDQLTFALKHEVLDLLVLKRIFEAMGSAQVARYVKAVPLGAANRRAWYLYEQLTGKTLGVNDVPKTSAVEVLDSGIYFTGKPRFIRRQRVKDNLLGTGKFCPLIRRTEKLEEYTGRNLADKVRETVTRTRAHLITRAASFMLLADSRASFEIEGEHPPRGRLERWGRAILQSGKNRLTLDEIVRLHHIIIEDNRFVQPGLRRDGIFLGERDHDGTPLPEFVGARFQDLQSLMDGLLEANDRMREDEVDPVLKAAATAFGFVYIHPLEDGNGRVHRFLIHHVLAEQGFSPPGFVFPVSSVMLDRIDDYRTTLQSHTAALMPYIEWQATQTKNVEVLNDTSDLYRYFDCTQASEFLYGCVSRTVEHDLPREIEYLRRHDQAARSIMETVEMPDQTAEKLLMFIRQNKGSLPGNRRRQEFRKLTDREVDMIENIVNEAFSGFDDEETGGSA